MCEINFSRLINVAESLSYKWIINEKVRNEDQKNRLVRFYLPFI